MTLLHPTALIGAVAVPLAVLIALWRARRQDLDVPSLVLWDRLRERLAEAGRRRRRTIDLPLLLGTKLWQWTPDHTALLWDRHEGRGIDYRGRLVA